MDESNISFIDDPFPLSSISTLAVAVLSIG